MQRLAPLYLLWLPSLINVSALWWGMVYRVRYSVLLLPAIAIFAALPAVSRKAEARVLIVASMAAMTFPWFSWYFLQEWKHYSFHPGPGAMVVPVSALILLLAGTARASYHIPLLALCVLAMQVPVFDGENRPLLVETLEHSSIEPEKREVLNYLHDHYDGTRILIDMGKQAPLVYDSGLPVKEFVYNEGERSHWAKAVVGPQTEVGWLCAENGDEVWNLLFDPHWAGAYALAVQTDRFRLFRLRSDLPARRFE